MNCSLSTCGEHVFQLRINGATERALWCHFLSCLCDSHDLFDQSEQFCRTLPTDTSGPANQNRTQKNDKREICYESCFSVVIFIFVINGKKCLFDWWDFFAAVPRLVTGKNSIDLTVIEQLPFFLLFSFFLIFKHCKHKNVNAVQTKFHHP